MRITTNAILRNYKSNLGTSLSNLDTARNKVMTRRQFATASQDPASALRAATLERRYLRNQDYLNTVENAQSFQDSQEDAAMQISNIALNLSKRYGIESLNGTNGSIETRQTYADAWRGAQESMVLSLNASYEGRYVFAGADGANPPFKLETDNNGNQILTYRGVDVNDPANQAILDELSKETVFVDMGFGLNMDNQNVVDPSSAFNTSLPGLNVIGYGTDANNNPKNMILLAGKIADTLEEPTLDHDKLKELLSVFDEGRNNLLSQVTTLGTKTEFLTTTKERLEASELSLATQYDKVVNVDMAGAISDFSWAQYAYNAALKVGTNILSPSFIDFMK